MAKSKKWKRVANMGVLDVIRILRNPRLAYVRLRPPNDYSPNSAVEKVLEEVRAPDRTVDFIREFQLDHEFHAAICDLHVAVRGRRLGFTQWAEFIYAAVRILKPKIVVLTGVFDGQADAAILRAMDRNEEGKLISIDLPATVAIPFATDDMKYTTLPPGKQPGWLVPDFLRSRYDLRFGDSRALLPRVLEEVRPIDIFIHDSLHTYGHQTFEYAQAWPALREGGLLMSDDIFGNMAFFHFCAQVEREPINIKGFGVIVK